ncbi:hypothetical_protein [Leishmania braziliensis MHOM/BR/75/M2904]|uniref:Hypothetical_protein n=1 Tax=Leishmania braziliensis MHOM/BR/75/M2904 TaxID=420245 RepID=A0A3P3ZBQ9_LEIBR|nr:hypothetical_protein [Leishmania braziliensis MHOM/BR/75/M2904]
MPRIKKPRTKGVTYKLVPRSYGDANGEDQGPLWVSETEFYRHHQSAAPVENDDAARRQFNMYTVAANAEFNDGEEYAEEEEYYDEEVEEEEGEWVNGDWEEEEEEKSPPQQAQKQKATATAPFASPSALASIDPPAVATRPRDEDSQEHSGGGEEDEPEEKLFDDEVECEVTDDFLHQLVFGTCDGSESVEDWDDWDGLDEEDSEMWRLLTDEERAAIKASRRRGTARRRRIATATSGAEGGLSCTHAADGTEYPMHDTTQRALERQFAEVMHEFNVDARLNDAYTDDPRTHGALQVDKYLTALEEFVASRAGIDLETAEPHKNKGLIQQLKYLSHHVGAFDSDARGIYMTTVLPEKQQRFVEDFQKGTEEIRRAARLRMAQRRAPVGAAATSSSDKTALPVPPPEEGGIAEEEKEELIVMEVKSKADQLDCETAVSAYSTYYNQPNVIHAPRSTAQVRKLKKLAGSRCEGEPTGAEAENRVSRRYGGAVTSATTVMGTGISSTEAAPGSSSGGNTASATIMSSAKKGSKMAHVRELTSDSGSEDTKKMGGLHRGGDFVLTIRRKDETKEEKTMRRQAVKAAQRERRQAKSALKHTYKEVESEELRRSATSQVARRTVHFM